ncbi:MAG TPA: glycosyltransferase family 39 protein [Terriglobales bacterium]|nr:glycosyltransferase family 39 protein [Terriglobales bacterium]
MSVARTPNLEVEIEHPSRPANCTPGWIAFAIVMLAVYVASMWTPALLDDADATHAEAAREMAQSGDFVTLKVNGIRYLEKAPLMYWMAAVSYRIFGENEFATRLPIFLGVVGCGLLATFWAQRAFGHRAGGYAGLMLSTAAGAYLFTRIFIPEVLLSLFMAGSLYCFLTALEEPRSAWRWYAGYALLALAVLTKGLVAGVFVAGTAFLYIAISGEWGRWREMRFFTGALLFLAIAAPWHILAGLRNQGGADGHGFFWFYFVNEHWLRFLGKRLPKDYNKMPAFAYWLGHLVWLFPWTLFLPAAIRDGWRQFHSRNAPRTFGEKTRLLCWIYAGVILIFFSLSTNQEYYTFPAYLPLSIVIAASLASAEDDAWETERPSPWIVPGQAVFAVLGMVIAIALGWGLWASRELPFVPDIGTVLARRGVGDYTLSTSHFFDLTAESFAALRLPAAWAAVTFVVGPMVALLLRLTKRHFYATLATVATAASFLVAAHIALERFESYLSSKQMATALNAVYEPDDKILIYGDQAYGSSLVFYYRRPVYLVNGRSTSMQFGSTFADVPKVFMDDAGLAEAWKSSSRVFVFVPEDKLGLVKAVIGEDIAPMEMRQGQNVLLSNRPNILPR